jgi:hypothetical protein
MNSQDKERWNELIRAAQTGEPDGSQNAVAPLDLLLAIDLELCALETLCFFRQIPGSLVSSFPEKAGS